MSILWELTRGTSFHSATAEQIPGFDIWNICFSYAYPEERFSIWRNYCSTSFGPVPPTPPTWHYFSCCPGVAYPTGLATTTINVGPTVCDCLTLSFLEIVWDATVGPWGGWQATNGSCTGGGVTLKVYPDGCIAGGMHWTCEMSWPGGSTSAGLNVPCGQSMLFENLKAKPPGCEFSFFNVIVTWDWALPA